MAPPTASSSSSSMTECRAFGVVPGSSVMQLADILRGLCARYSQLRLYEAVLFIPGNNSTFKMLRRLKDKRETPKTNAFQEKSVDRWSLLWESDPLRGPLFKELPAAVREVCESQCYCSNAPDFWQTLGARFEYDMVKEGNEYICNHSNLEFKVHLMKVLALTQPGNPDSPTKPNDRSGEKYLVEVSTRVPEGRHIDGARALGSFGGLLQPLVVLHRAEKPMGS